MKSKRLASRDKLYSILKNKFPQMQLRNSEEFEPTKVGGLYSKEIGKDTKGKELFNFNGKQPDYLLGVSADVYQVLDKHGWYAYFYNNETILIYPQPE